MKTGAGAGPAGKADIQQQRPRAAGIWAGYNRFEPVHKWPLGLGQATLSPAGDNIISTRRRRSASFAGGDDERFLYAPPAASRWPLLPATLSLRRSIFFSLLLSSFGYAHFGQSPSSFTCCLCIIKPCWGCMRGRDCPKRQWVRPQFVQVKCGWHWVSEQLWASS